MCSIVLKQSHSIFNNDINCKVPIINGETLVKLLIYKNKIDELDDTKLWDRAKKFSNDYELIHLPNKRNKKDSIALYEPLSRSYFKMLEMMIDYQLISEPEKINVCCLAEGPGGFMECINNYRETKDRIVGITLKSTNREIPGWKKSKNFLKNNQHINITYGKDETGDLYKLENIQYLKYMFNDKCMLVTADGGFDFSTDFNNQESMSYRIIFCEIVSALYLQKLGGHFVCKIFDIHTDLTVKFLWILSTYYDEIIISKPYTSRPANSEKYVICKNFNGIEAESMNQLFNLVKKWDTTKNKLDFIKVPSDFIIKINKYNELITNKQKDNIKLTLDIITNYESIEVTNSIIENQKVKALSWCNNYKVPINENSSFLK